MQAKTEIKKLQNKDQLKLFHSSHDESISNFLKSLNNSNIKTIGPELIFGKIFDFIGLNQIPDEYFRHFVIARLAFPLSKLKTVDYLQRYQGICVEISAVYRFLDKLKNHNKEEIEQIIFNHTKKVFAGNISVVPKKIR